MAEILLGIDFDNTIVKYDELFHQVALERSYITKDILAEKSKIRDYMIQNSLGEAFTAIQGIVYGKRIREAKPAKNAIAALTKLKHMGIKMKLISHKTKYPFVGPKYDLHASAIDWLNANNFFAKSFLNWSQSDVYFESTKEEKVRRIKSLGCTHYIDDLQSILDMIDDPIKRIHYNPSNNISTAGNNFIQINNWASLPDLFDNERNG